MRTEPILRYFKYFHLPPHLQEISRPFAELAERLAAGVEIPPWQELQPSFLRLRDFVRSLPAVDSAEKDYADSKLSEVWLCLFECAPASVPLRLLLEAKDCAVRAMIPLETAESSNEKQTTALHPPDDRRLHRRLRGPQGLQHQAVGSPPARKAEGEKVNLTHEPATLERVRRVYENMGPYPDGPDFARDFVINISSEEDSVSPERLRSRIERLPSAILSRKKEAAGTRVVLDPMVLLAASWEEVLRLEREEG